MGGEDLRRGRRGGGAGIGERVEGWNEGRWVVAKAHAMVQGVRLMRPKGDTDDGRFTDCSFGSIWTSYCLRGRQGPSHTS